MKKSTVYKVINHNKIICYKCATTTRIQEEILKHLSEMYEGSKNTYKVLENDILIKTFNSKKIEKKIKQNKAILEVNTGYVYNNVNELMDNLNLCKSDALKLVNKSFNYKFINQ
jgi:hypothetical protein